MPEHKKFFCSSLQKMPCNVARRSFSRCIKVKLCFMTESVNCLRLVLA